MFYLLLFLMKKHILKSVLSLIGIMGALAIWVVNATTTISEPYGHIDYTLNGNEDFEAQVITITDWTDTITILDRNLWATALGTWCEDSDLEWACMQWTEDATYWYHFQWWNNHGFKPNFNNDTSFPKGEEAKNYDVVNVDASSYWPWNYYSWSTFITDSGWSNNGDWSKVRNDNLRWWSLTETTDWVDDTVNIRDEDYLNWTDWKVDENTVTDRQWPCPEWFHVPSVWELAKLTKMFWLDDEWSNYEEVSKAMHTGLNIPFAGSRNYYYASVNNMGSYAYLWSSSPYSASNPFPRYIYLNVDGYLGMDYSTRAYANSVRCFYDSYQPFTQSFTLSFTGAEWGSISTWGIEAEEWSSISRDDEAGTVSISWTVVATGISDEWYAFSWWLTDCVSGTVTTGCSFTGVFKTIPYTITYLWTWDDYVPSATGFTIKSNNITLTEPSKTWYTFTWRSGTNMEWITWTVTISEWSTWNRIYEANREANEYKITIDIDGNETILTWKYGDPISKPADPTKNGYKFIGWEPEFPTTMPLSGATVKAKWEKLWSSGGWGGRSSSSVISSDSEKSTEWETWNQGNSQLAEQNSMEPHPNPLLIGEGNLEEVGEVYTQEFQEAYEFAKEKWITTMPTIQEAQMDWKLTRIAMAKMLSQYAINVLWQKPANIVTPKFNDVTDKQNSDYDDWVSLAYQLWIMWQNMPNNKFRPDDGVTRAEFATALSRMLYHTSDWEYKSTDKYYTNHMKKLVQEKIITNDDAKMKELRWYVMIMLMRSAGK